MLRFTQHDGKKIFRSVSLSMTERRSFANAQDDGEEEHCQLSTFYGEAVKVKLLIIRNLDIVKTTAFKFASRCRNKHLKVHIG